MPISRDHDCDHKVETALLTTGSQFSFISLRTKCKLNPSLIFSGVAGVAFMDHVDTFNSDEIALGVFKLAIENLISNKTEADWKCFYKGEPNFG